MKRIARVFPSQTKMSPKDEDAYFDVPPMLGLPDYDEVHISCTFNWDISRAYFLKMQWERVCDNVKIGGVSFGDVGKKFTPGVYLRKGVVITSRGCPNKCDYCFVWRRSQGLIELPITEGNIIQDDNFLACSDKHKEEVFKMLENEKQIEFSGGLEPERITVDIAKRLRSLRIFQLFLSCDCDEDLPKLFKAVEILKSVGFTRNHLRCYALIGREEIRLRKIFNMGCLPFSQLCQPEASRKYNYSKEYSNINRCWSRPAIMKTL